jgi:hypothetical protein
MGSRLRITRGLARGLLLSSNSKRGPNVFDVLEHENRTLRRVLELLKEQKRLLIVAQTPFYAIMWRTIADEHSIILPTIVIHFVLSQGGWKDSPCGVLQANLETLEVRTLLSGWPWWSGKLSSGRWVVNDTTLGLWIEL